MQPRIVKVEGERTDHNADHRRRGWQLTRCVSFDEMSFGKTCHRVISFVFKDFIHEKVEQINTRARDIGRDRQAGMLT